MTMEGQKTALGDIILECKAFAQPLGSENAWTSLGDGKFELHGHHIRVMCEEPPLPEAEVDVDEDGEGGEDGEVMGVDGNGSTEQEGAESSPTELRIDVDTTNDNAEQHHKEKNNNTGNNSSKDSGKKTTTGEPSSTTSDGGSSAGGLTTEGESASAGTTATTADKDDVDDDDTPNLVEEDDGEEGGEDGMGRQQASRELGDDEQHEPQQVLGDDGLPISPGGGALHSALSPSPVIILEDAITNDTPFVAKDGCLVWNRPERCVSLCIMFVSELGFQAAWSALLSMQQNPYPALEFDVFSPKAISPSLDSVPSTSTSAPGTPSAGAGPGSENQPPASAPKTVKTRPIDPRENTPEAQHDRILALLHPSALLRYSYVERHTIACSIIENDHGRQEGFPLFKDVAICVSLLKLGHTDLLEYLTSEDVYPRYVSGLEFTGLLPQTWVCPDGLTSQPTLGAMINTALRIHHLKNQVLPLHSDEEVTGVVDALNNRLQNEIVCSLVADEGMLSEVVEALKKPRMTTQQLMSGIHNTSTSSNHNNNNNTGTAGTGGTASTMTSNNSHSSGGMSETEIAALLQSKRTEEEESICVKLKFLTSLFSLTSQAFAKELVPAVLTKVCALGVVPALGDLCSHYLCPQQPRGDRLNDTFAVPTVLAPGGLRSPTGTETMNSLGSLTGSFPRTPGGEIPLPLGEEIGQPQQQPGNTASPPGATALVTKEGSKDSKETSSLSKSEKEKKEKRDKKDKKVSDPSGSKKEKEKAGDNKAGGGADPITPEVTSVDGKKEKKEKRERGSSRGQSRGSSAASGSLVGTMSSLGGTGTFTAEQMRAATLTQQAQSGSNGSRPPQASLSVTVFSRCIEKELGRFLEETVNRLNEKGEERTLSEVFRSAIVAEPERYECFMHFLLRSLASPGPMASNRLILYHLLGMHDDEGSGCDRKSDPEAVEAKNAFHHFFIEHFLPDAVRWSPVGSTTKQNQQTQQLSEAVLNGSAGSAQGARGLRNLRRSSGASADLGTVTTPPTNPAGSSTVGNLSPGMIRLLEYMFLTMTDDNRATLAKIVFGPRSGVVRYLLKDLQLPSAPAPRSQSLSTSMSSPLSVTPTNLRTNAPAASGGAGSGLIMVPTPPNSKPTSPALTSGSAPGTGSGGSVSPQQQQQRRAAPGYKKEVTVGHLRFLRAALGYKDTTGATNIISGAGSAIGVGGMGLMMGGHNLIVRSLFVEKDLMQPILQLFNFHKHRCNMFHSTVLSLLQTILTRDYLLDMRSLMMLRHRALLPAHFCVHCDKEALALLELKMKGGSQEECELTVRDISRSATPLNQNATVIMDSSFGSSGGVEHKSSGKSQRERMVDDGVNLSSLSPTPDNDCQWSGGMSSKVRSVIGSLSPSPHNSRSNSANLDEVDAGLGSGAGSGTSLLVDTSSGSAGNVDSSSKAGKLPGKAPTPPLGLGSSTSPTPPSPLVPANNSPASATTATTAGKQQTTTPTTKKPQAPSAPRQGSGGVRRGKSNTSIR